MSAVSIIFHSSKGSVSPASSFPSPSFAAFIITDNIKSSPFPVKPSSKLQHRQICVVHSSAAWLLPLCPPYSNTRPSRNRQRSRSPARRIRSLHRHPFTTPSIANPRLHRHHHHQRPSHSLDTRSSPSRRIAPPSQAPPSPMNSTSPHF